MRVEMNFIGFSSSPRHILGRCTGNAKDPVRQPRDRVDTMSIAEIESAFYSGTFVVPVQRARLFT
jgi:hypothetical protein